MNTEEIFEEDEGTLSSSQLPFLMIASQQSQLTSKNSSTSDNNQKYQHPSISMKKDQHNKVNYNGHVMNANSNNMHLANGQNNNNSPQNLNIIISNSVFNYKH